MMFAPAQSPLNSRAQPAWEGSTKTRKTVNLKTGPGLPFDTHLLVLGFCTDKAQEAELIEYGVEPDLIYMRGRGVESLSWCVDKLRHDPGEICVATDLRIFGNTKQEITDWLCLFHLQGVKVRDVITGETNPFELEKRAHKLLNSGTGMKDHRMARRRGGLGGKAKGNAASARRNALVDDRIAIRLCATKKLTWDEKAKILDMPKATIQRHYRN
jgi:hypothetical protein